MQDITVTIGSDPESARKRFAVLDDAVGGWVLCGDIRNVLTYIGTYLEGMEINDPNLQELEFSFRVMTVAEFEQGLKDAPVV